MTKTTQERLAVLRSGEYKKNRVMGKIQLSKYAELSRFECRAAFFEDIASEQIPNFIGDDPFGFNQYYTIDPKVLPFSITGNLTLDYEGFLKDGFSGMRERITAARGSADEKAVEFYTATTRILDAAEALANMYRKAAEEKGDFRLADSLTRIPAHGAKNYFDALLGIKFISFILRLNQSSHVTLGRFDKYMKPYFDASLAEGETKESLTELTELFFIAMNFDTDLYAGVQMGDNGQSLVIGGCDENGNDVWCELSEICLLASEELCIIDPKINVRVNSATPLEFYERCTKLTKLGLGFPQYSNDDVVIPGLVKLGYELADARDYSVAACWEFIIPRVGGDIPNAADVNYPARIQAATSKHLLECSDFEEFKAAVKAEIEKESTRFVEKHKDFVPYPDPLMSAFILPCIERGRCFFDGGAKYRNFGAHGAGLSTAADALTAIELGVFSGEIEKTELLDALKANFVGYDALRAKLLSYPKMGMDNECADKNGEFLLNCYSEALQGKPTGTGGIWRAGTGSALNYITHANLVGATADGKAAKEPYGANLSPSLNAKISSPTDAVRSFSKFDMAKTINGGPFTIEVHDTVFSSPEGERKIASLVKSYIDLGGHQIQINSIRRETLLEAQKHPEQYKNIIVRVWGWSGYFVELDKPYQDHVIRRTEFTV